MTGPSNTSSLSLVIPFFNESVNVTTVSEQVIAELRKAGISYELLLVDNGSHDDTRQRIQAVVQEHPEARLVIVERNVGYGAGVLEGLRHANGDVLGFMWGDGQVDPQSVVQVYQKVIQEGLAFCKATRVVRHDGWRRALLTSVGNRLFRWCFPAIRTWDINGNPKVFTREWYGQLTLTSMDWFLDAECVIKTSLAGVPMGEVPTESPPRQAGRSHVRWRTVVEFAWNLVRYRWGGALVRRCVS